MGIPPWELRIFSASAPAAGLGYQLRGEPIGLRNRPGLDRVLLRYTAGALGGTVGIFNAALPLIDGGTDLSSPRQLSPVARTGRGVELRASRREWEGAIGCIESSRHLQPSSARDFRRLGDTYLRLMRTGDGPAFGIQWNFDRQDSNRPELPWMQHLMGEAAARFGGARVSVTPAYVFSRFDDRPGLGIHERHQFARVESMWGLDAGSHWVVGARAEHEHQARNALARGRDADLEMLSLSWIPEPRLRIVAEGSSGGTAPRGPRTRGGQLYFSAGL